jgi:hypothetical protein
MMDIRLHPLRHAASMSISYYSAGTTGVYLIPNPLCWYNGAHCDPNDPLAASLNSLSELPLAASIAIAPGASIVTAPSRQRLVPGLHRFDPGLHHTLGPGVCCPCAWSPMRSLAPLTTASMFPRSQRLKNHLIPPPISRLLAHSIPCPHSLFCSAPWRAPLRL